MATHPTATLVAAALALALPAFAWGQSDCVSRAYDVMALTVKLEDDPGPRLELDEPTGDGGGGTTIGGAVDERGNITIDGIWMLIQDNIDPGTWEGERRISARGSTLVVVAPPETHAKIAALLAWLRATHARPIILELAVYEAPAAQLDAVLSGGSVLDAPQVEALEKSPWTRLMAARLVSGPDQRVHVGRIANHAYLKDVDIEVAEGAHVYDHEIGLLRLGIVDEVRAVRADGGHGLVVELRHTGCDGPIPMPTFDTGLRSRTGQPVKPLDLPTQQVRRVRNALWIPQGGSAIAAAARLGDVGRVLVLRHVDPPTAKLEPVKGDGKRMMRIFDMRYALFEAPDFKSPRLDTSLTSWGGGGVGGALFDAGEEGVRLSKDALMEIIQADVDEDSWHNDRNRLASIGGHLIVHQTPETLAKLEVFLADLERVRSVSLLVRSRLLAASDGETERALVAVAGTPLTVAARAEIAERIASGRGLSVVSDLATAALPGQRVHVGVYDNVAYLKDHDAEIATKCGELDPEVSLVKPGTILDVRPTLVHERDQVMLELRLTDGVLRSIDTRELADGARLQVPVIDATSRLVTLVVPNGGSAIIGLGGGRYAQIDVAISREKKE